MRIRFVTREFAPLTAYSGGIGTNHGALARELVSQGHDVELITTDVVAGVDDLNEGVRVRVLDQPPGRLWAYHDLWWTAHVALAQRKLSRPDIVFAAEYGGDMAAGAVTPGRPPLVTQLATSLDQVDAMGALERGNGKGRRKVLVQRRLERWQAERSDGLVASTRAVLDWAQELWLLDGIPAVVIPNFVEPAPIRKLARGSLPKGYPSEGPRVAFVGRLEARKGIDVLARAMRIVWNRFPEAQLVLLGADGRLGGRSMIGHVREIVGSHGPSVHWLGSVPSEHLFPALAAADVVVQPSLWENFSLAALEVRALGKAAIVTTGSGFDDFFTDGHDGLMVPPGKVEPLAEAIERLLGDSDLRQRLARVAFERADDYRPAPITGRFVDFFADVAESGYRGPRSRSRRSQSCCSSRTPRLGPNV